MGRREGAAIHPSVRPFIRPWKEGGGVHRAGGTELRNARKHTHDGASDILDAAAEADTAAFSGAATDTNWMREREGPTHNISVVT